MGRTCKLHGVCKVATYVFFFLGRYKRPKQKPQYNYGYGLSRDLKMQAFMSRPGMFWLVIAVFGMS